jgi:hypothetical protein
MKTLTTIILAFTLLTFTSCKKEVATSTTIENQWPFEVKFIKSAGAFAGGQTAPKIWYQITGAKFLKELYISPYNRSYRTKLPLVDGIGITYDFNNAGTSGEFPYIFSGKDLNGKSYTSEIFYIYQ